MSIAAALPAPPSGPAGASCAVGWAELVAERAHLVRFARRRLLDPTLAEDLVHDVFEAVIGGRAPYAGRSSLRSWLTGILKHKIVDLVRQRSGHDSLDQGSGEDDEPPALVCPQPRPDEAAEHRQRLDRVLLRVQRLPASLRRVIELRALEDADSREVCRELGISSGNLFVRLHRARALLAA